MEVYADKALKLKSAYHCTQANQQRKSFIARVVSLNSCDLFLTVLMDMHKQQNCSHKTWHIRIEIVLIAAE